MSKFSLSAGFVFKIRDSTPYSSLTAGGVPDCIGFPSIAGLLAMYVFAIDWAVLVFVFAVQFSNR